MHDRLFWHLRHSVLSIIFLSFLFVHSGVAQSELDDDHVEGAFLIQLVEGMTMESFLTEFKWDEAANDIPEDATILSVKSIFPSLNVWEVNTEWGAFEGPILEALRADHSVVLAQLNHIIGGERQVPNDAQYNQQWHHNDPEDDDMDTEEAWDITTGGTTSTGHRIVAAVLEPNGFDFSHPDVDDNIWVNNAEAQGIGGVDDDGNGFVDDVNGWNFDNGNGTFDVGYHGLAVSGMLGAEGNNGIGGAGVNWDVDIMGVQIQTISDNTPALIAATEANALEAYSYVLGFRQQWNDSEGASGAFVVTTNASFGIDNGNPVNFPIWCAVYDALGEVGILSCGATTNSTVNVDVVNDMPTGCTSPYLIGVGRSWNNDGVNGGTGSVSVDLAAPGGNVFLPDSGNVYGTTTGTSFATPAVAGTIALMYSIPDTDRLIYHAMHDPQWTADQMREALFAGVDVFGAYSTMFSTSGRLNVNNALLETISGFDDEEGTCGWYIPENPYEFYGPAVLSCDPIEGMMIAGNPGCVQAVIDNDPYCINTAWDNICQTAYATCACGPASENSPPVLTVASNYQDQNLTIDCYTMAQEGITMDDLVADLLAAVSYEDDCDEPLVINVVDEFIPGCGQTGILNVWIYCADIHNAVSSVEFSVYISDILGPVLDGPEDLVYNAEVDGPNPVSLVMPQFSADDACSESSLSAVIVDTLYNFDVPNEREFLIQVLGTDACGNNSAAIVHVQDVTPGLNCGWYLPQAVFGPAVFSCAPVEGYVYAENQNCADNVTYFNPSCSSQAWDVYCANAYENCGVGCTDPEACNFDADAATDDGSCAYLNWVIPIDVEAEWLPLQWCTSNPMPEGYWVPSQECVEYVMDIDPYCIETAWDFICLNLYEECLSDTEGCLDETACNYNPEAGGGNASCAYPGDLCSVATDCLNPGVWSAFCECETTLLDTDGDGICDGEEVFGCTHPEALNYDPSATEDDGSCWVPGCKEPDACNYDPVANVDDGSCLFPGDLCINSTNCNSEGYLDENCDCWFEGPGDADGDGICDNEEIPGCTDEEALNFNPEATDDDGSCDYFQECIDEDSDGYCADVDCDDANPLLNIDCGLILGCTDMASCNYDPFAVVDDGSCIAPDYWIIPRFEEYGPAIPWCGDPLDIPNWYMIGEYFCVESIVADNSSCLEGDWNYMDCEDDYMQCIIEYGCQDEAACNYDPAALYSDDSCAYPGDSCADFNCTAEATYNDECECVPVVIIDTDGDGICDADENAGCTDPEAENFDPEATDSDPESCIYFGCTDETAINFNPMATVDDGSCIPAIYGCMNPDASNWNPDANVDDGSCELPYSGCTDPAAINFDSSAETDDGSCEYESGCTDETADNFNPDAVEDDGSCEYGNTNESEGCTDPDADNYDPVAEVDDGSCEYGNDVQGCTDPSALNFDPDAEVDDGSCSYESGCTDPGALNYNPSAVVDDGSCEYNEDILGCMDSEAQNFDPSATVDDGSCDYGNEPDSEGCSDPAACNYEPDVMIPNISICVYPEYGYSCDGLCASDADGDGICDAFEIPGCTLSGAMNYNPYATDDDGSCVWPPVSGCTDATACNYDPDSEVDNGTCVYTAYPWIGCDGTCVNDADADGICDEEEVPGCMTLEAMNYNPFATDEDGSCLFANVPGCTYANADNYDSAADYDDGSCLFTFGDDACSEDIDSDGLITISDLLQLLSVFGDACD